MNHRMRPIFTILVHVDLTEEDGKDFTDAALALKDIADRHGGMDLVFRADKPDGSEASMPTAAADLPAVWLRGGSGEN